MQYGFQNRFRRSPQRVSAGWAIGLIALLAGSVLGCAASNSSGSASDSFGSVSDSFGSFSDSSTSSSGDDTAYREDIQSYTVAHVQSHSVGAELDRLRLGLSEVALARGISDWEALPGTFLALGAGLAEAGVAPSEMATYHAAFAHANTNRDRQIRHALGEGYQSFQD